MIMKSSVCLAALAALVAIATGCSKESEASVQKSASPAVASPASPAASQVKTDTYEVALVADGECKKDQVCSLKVNLKAQGEYHINDEYPYKFVGQESDGVDFQGKTSFSKSAGDFSKTGEKTGVLTIKFKATKAGATTVKGKFKMSVCSKDKCLLQEPDLELSVPVK
jgi:hypothetical protein